jgi:hypothetical protein
MAIEKSPPVPLPETLWGKEWRFATFPAGDLVEYISDRPLPFLSIPEKFSPLKMGLASTVPIPGIIIYGGRNSFPLARWLEEVNPVSVDYIPVSVGESGGLILESGLVDRWILATFEDLEVAKAGEIFKERQSVSGGLHFLWIQPDDSGMTDTGFWLLRKA